MRFPGYTVRRASGLIILGASALAASCPADTSEDILATITVPASALGLYGILRTTLHWSMTNSANNKVLRSRFSGASGTVYGGVTLTTVTNFRQTFNISNRGLTNSQHGVDGTNGGFNTGVGPVTSAVDTTVATSLVITGQKASSGETLTLDSYLVELLRP